MLTEYEFDFKKKIATFLVSKDDKYLYVLGKSNELKIFLIENYDDEPPVSLDLPENCYEKMFIIGGVDKLVVSDNQGNLYWIDIKDPTKPV